MCANMNYETDNQNCSEENEKLVNDSQISCAEISADIKNEEIKPIKKKKTKIIFCIVFVFLFIACSILIYFKLNENVFRVEKMINNMGEITIDSEKIIQDTEKSYNSLSDSEKKRVKNKDVLDENKKLYKKLFIESFESSEVYNLMKKTISSSMALYDPKMTFDKDKKTLTINLSVNSDIEELLLYYPGLARPAWNQTVRNLNDLTKKCFDMAAEYEIDVVMEMHPKSSSYLMLFESLNGETKFNILD